LLGDIVAFLFSLFVLLMMMVAVAEGIRSYYRHRGYRRDLRDHLAFLDRYNRADSPVAGLGRPHAFEVRPVGGIDLAIWTVDR